MLLAESGPTTSLAETGNHGLSQRRSTKHGLSQGETPSNRARENGWLQNFAHHQFSKTLFGESEFVDVKGLVMFTRILCCIRELEGDAHIPMAVIVCSR